MADIQAGQVWLDADYRSYYDVDGAMGHVIHAQRRVLVLGMHDGKVVVKSLRNGRHHQSQADIVS